MSSTEPPAGSTPPPGEPTPPAPPPPAAATPPPPTNPGTVPPPPPPAGAMAPGAAMSGVGQPGNLLDRFLARLIDFVIIAIVGFIIRVVLGAISDSYFVYYLVDAVITAALYLGYFAYFESSRGQTIGKQVMKLKTMSPTGQNPTMNEAIKRNIWLGAPILGVLWLPGYLLAFVVEVVGVILCAVGINSDPQRQHWFDKFAGGTKVMKVG